MSSVEYDVLVKLHVDRKGGRALGDAAKPLQKGLSLADKQARAAAAQRMRELKAADAANRKSVQSAQRGAIADARERIAGKRRVLAEQKKLAAAEKAASKAFRSSVSDKASKFTGGAKAIGDSMGSIGMGPLMGWATRAGAVVGGILAGAITAALGKATLDGLGDNISGEQQKGSLATTMQLYDFNTNDAKGNKRTDAEQFAENLENARWYQSELTRIADASPGDANQVGELFTGMLPGMASITQDADRIMDLTQKATLLAAVLDNDFKSVGAQSSRILTGGAGAEMETWNRLQKPIRQAGVELGVFNKNQAMGTALTEKFNKLAPEQRLKLFEEGIKRLGKPVADYFENSFEGITSQAKSSLKALRKELGRGGFEAIKARTKQMNKGGILDKNTEGYKRLFDFAGFLGDSVGKGISKAMGGAETAALWVANHWETIVSKAIYAGQVLAEGAKTAVELLAVKTGVGMGMKAGGAVLSGAAGLAQTAASIMALGPAALIAAPAIIGMGVVMGGLSLILGGAVAYVVTNLDTLSRTFMEWKETAGQTIDAFWLSVETLGTKFVALGEYFIGPADSTETFTNIVDTATSIVYAVTDAFSWLLGMTADVVEGFGTMMDNLAVFIGGITGKGPDYEKLNMLQMGLEQATQGGFIGQEKDAMGGYWDSKLANEYRDKIAEEEAKGMPQYGVTGKQWADKIRGGKAAFDAAGGNRKNLEEVLFKREQDRLGSALIGPVKPTSSDKNRPKPPKVNMKVTQHLHMNIRDTDPNAVVAAYNKNAAGRLALPLASALAAATRRG